MSQLPAPIDRPQTFSGRSVEVLRAMVLDGRLRPGDRLNEVELAAALGISRGPLREAIQRLSSEGLLTPIANRGAYVRTITAGQLREIYEVRIALETHAVRLLAAGDADAMDSLCDPPPETGPPGTDPDLGFHRRFVWLTGNAALLAATVEVHRQIELAGQTTMAGSPQESRWPQEPRWDQRAAAEHEEMWAHLRAGRGDRAAVILTRHLRSALRHALAVRDIADREL